MEHRAIVWVRRRLFDVRQETADTLEREGFITFHDDPRSIVGFYKAAANVAPAIVIARIEQLEG